MYDVIVVGCGAAGMMAGITLAEKGKKVIILEKNEKPGKKLFITGKGRCNLTNNCDKDELYKNVVSNPKFLFSSFDNFDSYKTMDFFEKELGLNIKTERGNRVFPVSNHSSDVINVLQRKLNKLGVKIRLNCEVKDIITKPVDISDNSSYDNEKYENKADKHTSYVTGVEYKNEDGKIQLLESKNVVVATGGLSYPRTGSTGDGIKWAKKLELKVTEPVPALVPLVVKEEDICKRLMGLSLKNIKVSFTALVKNKKKEVYSEFGEMLFTHFGVSGPVILSASSYLTKYFDNELKLSIDFKPALSPEQLDSRLLRDFENNINKQFQNSLDELLPKSLIPVIIDRSGIEPYKKVNSVTKEERLRLLELLKGFSLNISGPRGFDEAIITQGGVSVKEINPKTMESKKIKGLYFAGEVLDLDAVTGGFNLQIAWSSARMVGGFE